jgi:hypothetical protein
MCLQPTACNPCWTIVLLNTSGGGVQYTHISIVRGFSYVCICIPFVCQNQGPCATLHTPPVSGANMQANGRDLFEAVRFLMKGHLSNIQAHHRTNDSSVPLVYSNTLGVFRVGSVRKEVPQLWDIRNKYYQPVTVWEFCSELISSSKPGKHMLFLISLRQPYR